VLRTEHHGVSDGGGAGACGRGHGAGLRARGGHHQCCCGGGGEDGAVGAGRGHTGGGGGDGSVVAYVRLLISSIDFIKLGDMFSF
jgi:hypothetical protein